MTKVIETIDLSDEEGGINISFFKKYIFKNGFYYDFNYDKELKNPKTRESMIQEEKLHGLDLIEVIENK